MPDEAKGLEVAGSIGRLGLLNPITISLDGVLLAGRHRLEAVRLLGNGTIEARVVDIDQLRAELVEIDANLIRKELTGLERAEHLQRCGCI